MKKLLFVLMFLIASASLYAQGKVFFYGEKQCVYVIADSMIHESGSTNCTPRGALYNIKGDKIYYHDSPRECALKIVDGKVYFPSRNKNEIDRPMWVIKDNELVYTDRQSEPAFIIEGNKVYFGSGNKISRKDRPIIVWEGDVPMVALYMILNLISQ